MSYNKGAVALRYPGNWKITEDKTEKSTGVKIHYLNVESPDNGIFLIVVFSKPIPLTVQQWHQNLASARGRHVEDMTRVGGKEFGKAKQGKTTEIVATIGGKKTPGVREKFNMTLLGEAVPHITEVFRVSNKARTAYLQTQAPEEDWAKERPGFNLVLSSFRLSEKP